MKNVYVTDSHHYRTIQWSKESTDGSIAVDEDIENNQFSKQNF
jgi:hypothetical protein